MSTSFILQFSRKASELMRDVRSSLADAEKITGLSVGRDSEGTLQVDVIIPVKDGEGGCATLAAKLCDAGLARDVIEDVEEEVRVYSRCLVERRSKKIQ